MVNVRNIARLGILAAGLGIGAAVASTPGIASADPFSFDPNDIAISFDGTTLFQEGSAAAYSGSAGEFNFAFADGTDAEADAPTGTGNVAFADGTEAYGDAQNGTGNIAEADGTNAVAIAEGGNSDTAIDIGNNGAPTFNPDSYGAYAGEGILGGTGSNDFAFALGDSDEAYASGFGGTVVPADGSNDIAVVFGTGSDAYVGASLASPGDFDLGAVFGDGLSSDAANGGNYLVDILPTVAGLDSALSTLLSDLGSLF